MSPATSDQKCYLPLSPLFCLFSVPKSQDPYDDNMLLPVFEITAFFSGKLSPDAPLRAAKLSDPLADVETTYFCLNLAAPSVDRPLLNCYPSNAI